MNNEVRTLVAPSALNIEYIEIDSAQKKLIVIHKDNEPREILSGSYPPALWSYPPEKMTQKNLANACYFYQLLKKNPKATPEQKGRAESHIKAIKAYGK